MGLLVDGGLTTVAVLKEHDTGVFETSAGEGIDLAGKLRLAENEVKAEIERFLARLRQGSAAQVVVSESMRLWHAWKTLEAVYRDAYFSQLNDRYKARWEHYKSMSANQRSAVLEEGIGLVSNPLRRPGKPIVLVESGTMPSGAYAVTVAAVNSAGEESAISEAQLVTPSLNCSLRIRPSWLPQEASGWLVYAGELGAQVALQAGSPISPGEEFVIDGQLAPGRPPGDGQSAREWIMRNRRLG